MAEGGGHVLRFQGGPIVSNLVLVDEIDHATLKTHSALLEGMQERWTTVAQRTIRMPETFCVMARQNPVDHEGTYPLSEAQHDRFLLKLLVIYRRAPENHGIIDRSTSGERLKLRPVTEVAKAHAMRLVMATQPSSDHVTAAISRTVALDASPRGILGLVLAAKAQALLDGRFAIATDDLAAVAMAVLRHRVVTSFHARAANPTQMT
nr:AAA family ATPase [Sphingomonas elodea]